jgi:hypothetical protein
MDDPLALYERQLRTITEVCARTDSEEVRDFERAERGDA